MLQRNASSRFLTPLLLIALLFTPVGSAALDHIVVKTQSSTGQTVLKFYSPTDGSYVGEIPIRRSFDDDTFLSGQWLPGELSVVALKKQKKDFTAYVLNEAGDAAAELALGKNVLHVITADLDGSGINDLAVQPKKKGNATVWYDPGIPGAGIGNAPVSRSGDLIQVYHQNSVSLGYAQFSKKSKKGKKRKKKGKKQKSAVFYTDESGSPQRINTPKKIKQVLPLKVTGEAASFLGLSPKILSAFSSSGVLRSASNDKSSSVVTGFFNSDDEIAILVGNRSGEVTIADPLGNGDRDLDLDLNATADSSIPATLAMTADCEEYERILEEIENTSDIQRILELLEQLDNLDITQCLDIPIDDPPPPPGNDFPLPPGSSGPEGEGIYVGTNVSYGSAADKAKGPCDKFLNANDGVNGFLAKNSDHGGVVYLAPNSGYRNGKILNNKSLKLVEKTRYTGIANGGRAHFRTGGSLPREAHVFAADFADGKTHCWRIPGGKSRVD